MKINPYIYPIISYEKTDILINKISNHFNISLADLKSKKRNREIVICRHFCFYFIKKQCKLSNEKIGFIFLRNHSSVTLALNQMNYAVKTYYKEYYEQLKKIL